MITRLLNFLRPRNWVQRLYTIDAAAKCPTCGCNMFHEGPHGGEAVNVKCAGCGAFWWYGGPFGFKAIESDHSFYNLHVAKRMEDIA